MVLEGNDYIGGRMKNKDFGGASVPLGPGWIHFPEENHILVQLALKYNLSKVLDTLTLREIIFRYVWDVHLRHYFQSFKTMCKCKQDNFEVHPAIKRVRNRWLGLVINKNGWLISHVKIFNFSKLVNETQ